MTPKNDKGLLQLLFEKKRALEVTIVGTCLLDASAFYQARNFLSPKAFIIKPLSHIWEVMGELADKQLNIDMLTIYIYGAKFHQSYEKYTPDADYYTPGGLAKLSLMVDSTRHIHTHCLLLLEYNTRMSAHHFILAEAKKNPGYGQLFRELSDDFLNPDEDVFELLDLALHISEVEKFHHTFDYIGGLKKGLRLRADFFSQNQANWLMDLIHRFFQSITPADRPIYADVITKVIQRSAQDAKA